MTVARAAGKRSADSLTCAHCRVLPVAGDVRERVQGDAEHLVDVEGRADRLADAVQDADMGLDVHRRSAHGAPDQLAELLEARVVPIREVERVPVVVGADEDRRNVEPDVAVG